jgi:hypothetical protein
MRDVVVLLLGALAVAVIGFLVTRHGPTVERSLFRRKAVRATTELDTAPPRIKAENDPAIFEAGGPNWEAYGFVFPPGIEAVGTPPSEICREWRQWARGRGGVDARSTKAQVTVEGRSDGTVVIDRFEIEVTARRDALPGTYAACPVGGASGSPRQIYVVLDNDPPAIHFVDSGDEPVKHFLFTLTPGEVETFLIYAVADRCYCEWTAHLSYVAHGKRDSILISDEGDAFKTTGVRNAEGYAWFDGHWRRDFLPQEPDN